MDPRLHALFVIAGYNRMGQPEANVDPERGALPSNGLIGMWRWMGHIFTTRLTIMGSPFQALSIELLEWGRTFLGL